MDGKRYLPSDLIGLPIIIAVQIGGFALLWSKDTTPPEYAYLPATAGKTANNSVNTPVVVVSPPDEKALRQIIQAVLEQGLAPYARQLAAASANTQVAAGELPGVKENSPENLRAFTEATSIIETAIAQGKWTNDETVKMNSQSAHLTLSQRSMLIEQIVQAINKQELKINAPPPAF